MKIKKLISTALAGAIALSLAAPAFAAAERIEESQASSYEIELSGMIYTPTIRVLVTPGESLYVNPTGGAVAGTIEDGLYEGANLPFEYGTRNDTILSSPILIRSDTETQIDIYATATATVPEGSGLTLVDESDDISGTAKQAYLTIGGSMDLETAELTENGITNDSLSSKSKGALKLPTGGSDPDGKTAELTTATKVAQIAAADYSASDDEDGATNKSTYGIVVVAGGVNTDAVGWSEEDVVDITLILTFSLVSA